MDEPKRIFFAIRNGITGALMCDNSMQILTFATIYAARSYIGYKKINPEVFHPVAVKEGRQ